MTNGEKFKEVFKTSDVDEGLLYAFVWLSKPDEVAEINIEWWNEEYKEPTTKNDLGVDWDELKRKILMEVDGGTDDAWLAYGEVCDRISNSIDEFVADMRGNAKRKGEPIEGNNESYNCENWIP